MFGWGPKQENNARRGPYNFRKELKVGWSQLYSSKISEENEYGKENVTNGPCIVRLHLYNPIHALFVIDFSLVLFLQTVVFMSQYNARRTNIEHKIYSHTTFHFHWPFNLHLQY